jgi:hypothetical protein
MTKTVKFLLAALLAAAPLALSAANRTDMTGTQSYSDAGAHNQMLGDDSK